MEDVHSVDFPLPLLLQSKTVSLYMIKDTKLQGVGINGIPWTYNGSWSHNVSLSSVEQGWLFPTYGHSFILHRK